MSGTDWEACFAGLQSGFASPTPERDALEVHSGKGAANYGEITASAANRLLAWLRPGPDDLLLDLGSGCARLLIQALCETSLGRAVGIEAVPHRHRVAMAARQRLAETDPARAAKLELYRGDFCALELPEASLVYLGATCFPDPLLARIATRVGRLSGLRRLICTRPLPASLDRSFTQIGQLRLDMSWVEDVPVEVYGPRRA